MHPMIPLELPRKRGIGIALSSSVTWFLDFLVLRGYVYIYIYSQSLMRWLLELYDMYISYIYIYVYRSPLISIVANLYQASICSRMAWPKIDCRTISVPSMHPYNERRALLRDPMPWHMNDNFTTSNDSYGSLAWNTGRTFFLGGGWELNLQWWRSFKNV